MTKFLVPKRVSSNSVEIWIGWWSEDKRPPLTLVLYTWKKAMHLHGATIRVEEQRQKVKSKWVTLGEPVAAVPKLRSTSVLLNDLTPNTYYKIHLIKETKLID